MLTADLVRGTLRQGVVHPRFIQAHDPALIADAETLLGLVRNHVGATVGELDEAVGLTFSGRPDILFVRGLAKLVMDLTDAEAPLITTRSDPDTLVAAERIRDHLFTLSASAFPVRPGGGADFTDRAALVARAAEDLDLSPEDLERGLYADLGSAQLLTKAPDLGASALLERYNLALAQACLLRARQVRVVLTGPSPQRAQALFRALKFRRLLFRILPATPPSDATPATPPRASPKTSPKAPPRPSGASARRPAEPPPPDLRLVLDGPLSLFKHTSRYGIQLAHFLPELARNERWELEADIRWGRERRDALLRLSNRSPFSAHTPDRGTWKSAEQTHLEASFAALDTPWELRPVASVLDLDGEDVLIPDYQLAHPDGRLAWVELVFAWRLETFQRRLALLSRAGPKNLIVALTDRGRFDEGSGELTSGLTMYRFKGLIQPKRLLALAESVATRP